MWSAGSSNSTSNSAEAMLTKRNKKWSMTFTTCEDSKGAPQQPMDPVPRAPSREGHHHQKGSKKNAAPVPLLSWSSTSMTEGSQQGKKAARQKAQTLSSWGPFPGKKALFDQLAKLKSRPSRCQDNQTTSHHHHDGSGPDARYWCPPETPHRAPTPPPRYRPGQGCSCQCQDILVKVSDDDPLFWPSSQDQRLSVCPQSLPTIIDHQFGRRAWGRPPLDSTSNNEKSVRFKLPAGAAIKSKASPWQKLECRGPNCSPAGDQPWGFRHHPYQEDDEALHHCCQTDKLAWSGDCSHAGIIDNSSQRMCIGSTMSLNRRRRPSCKGNDSSRDQQGQPIGGPSQAHTGCDSGYSPKYVGLRRNRSYGDGINNNEEVVSLEENPYKVAFSCNSQLQKCSSCHRTYTASKPAAQGQQQSIQRPFAGFCGLPKASLASRCLCQPDEDLEMSRRDHRVKNGGGSWFLKSPAASLSNHGAPVKLMGKQKQDPCDPIGTDRTLDSCPCHQVKVDRWESYDRTSYQHLMGLTTLPRRPKANLDHSLIKSNCETTAPLRAEETMINAPPRNSSSIRAAGHFKGPEENLLEKSLLIAKPPLRPSQSTSPHRIIDCDHSIICFPKVALHATNSSSSTKATTMSLERKTHKKKPEKAPFEAASNEEEKVIMMVSPPQVGSRKPEKHTFIVYEGADSSHKRCNIVRLESAASSKRTSGSEPWKSPGNFVKKVEADTDGPCLRDSLGLKDPEDLSSSASDPYEVINDEDDPSNDPSPGASSTTYRKEVPPGTSSGPETTIDNNIERSHPIIGKAAENASGHKWNAVQSSESSIVSSCGSSSASVALKAKVLTLTGGPQHGGSSQSNESDPGYESDGAKRRRASNQQPLLGKGIFQHFQSTTTSVPMRLNERKSRIDSKEDEKAEKSSKSQKVDPTDAKKRVKSRSSSSSTLLRTGLGFLLNSNLLRGHQGKQAKRSSSGLAAETRVHGIQNEVHRSEIASDASDAVKCSGDDPEDIPTLIDEFIQIVGLYEGDSEGVDDEIKLKPALTEEDHFRSQISPVTMEIFSPVLLEQRDLAASQTLRAALCKAEASHPGFSYDLVLGLVRKSGDTPINMNESLLRLQGAVSDHDSHEYRSSRTEEPFQELNKKSASLKRILSRIPDEITDRKTFLETIKEIASAIKKLLDAVNEVSAYIPGSQGKAALEQRKREFVKYSKRFSNTLKEYFKEGQPAPVFTSATYLIYQTNQVMITVKDKCE